MGFVVHQRRDPNLLQVLKQLLGSGPGRASKWASQPRLPLADALTSLSYFRELMMPYQLFNIVVKVLS